MSLDVIIRRKIAFVGCILIIPAIELSKISRSLFMALQWRRRCISSSISFDSHLVHIRWFIGVIGLLNRPLSIFKSCELIHDNKLRADPALIPDDLYIKKNLKFRGNFVEMRVLNDSIVILFFYNAENYFCHLAAVTKLMCMIMVKDNSVFWMQTMLFEALIWNCIYYYLS